MGSRADVVLHFGENEVLSLYTHWGRDGIQEVVKRALQRAAYARWSDFGYLARIIFSEMILAEGTDPVKTLNSNLGLGIFPNAGCPALHKQIRLYQKSQTVEIWDKTVVSTMTFAEFIQQQ